MADSTKKRKRPSLSLTHSHSHSLRGIITRSKSQIHIHRNRSGKSRTHSIRVGKYQDLQPLLKKPRKSSPAEDSVGCDLSSVSIKDLRLRRVFSPSSTHGVIPNCLDDSESEVAGNCLDGRKKDCGNGDFRKLEISNEEFVQSTPPDAEIVGVEQVVESNEGENMKKEKGSPEERNDMNYSTKSVLRPCSRVKIFKTPGSFSLRRLLPYLMDIKKDCSGSGCCPKTKNGFEEKQLLDSNVEEALGDKSMATNCFLEDHSSVSGKEMNRGSVESFTSHDNDSSSMPLVNGEIKKFELQVSTEDQNSNCLKSFSSSTIEESHFSKEDSAGVLSNDQMLADDGEVAKTNVESCDYNEVTENANEEIKLCKTEDNNAVVVEKVEDLNVQFMSVTPPDSGIVSKMETDDSRVDCLSQGTNHDGEKSKNETVHRNRSQGSDKSLDTSPKNKLVPNQRLHPKLSKIPGSFSYRRLLPFLIDLTNDISCASRNDQSLEVEKSSREKPLSIGFTSARGACTETFDCKSRAVEQNTGDGIRVPVTEAAAIGCSSDDKPTQSPKQVTGSLLIPDSKQEHASVIKHAALDANQKLEASPKNVVELSAMSSSPFINSGLLRREEADKSVSCRLTFETKTDTTKSTAKCANRVKKSKADSLGEASTPIGFPIVCLKKGILKRNPPGCRGNCSCLNCSSFRLHAERAFEFSRNQMQDAEEVALDLIRELSFLRNVLEKSASGAKDQSSISINEVKDACKKASEAEELAKIRLSEMNYDLNIHCRIPCGQRPSVRFANYVEKQIIPVADSSNK
ncbi:hypothetical protein HRI_000104700 [Hibiscus trionum]|uniref:Uncharacterized protein n=1 Tax=Hibiscus trionum TaxID=183268 RepID=A0A9W7LHL7_HIBTR|nr:hypothetical protein HRI_000104700 [Hibiscus trionum]